VGNDYKIVALLSLLAFAGCKNTATCKPHTVLLKITLEGAAANADMVEVDVSIGHDNPATKSFTPQAASGSVEIDFSNGYPVGKELEVSLTAFRGTEIVGLGSSNTFLTGSCAAIPIPVAGTQGADLSANLDLAGTDGTIADFATEPDLIPPPSCTMSSTCPATLPVCDNSNCRSCTSASDDPTCVARSASTPHCKLLGTNAGQCAQCNVNADCPTATPTCKTDGTCHKCTANSDCDTLICDRSGTATDGQCIPASDIVYVNSANDPGQGTCTDGAPGGKDGSLAHPFCQITTALTLLGVQTRHYIHVEGSDSSYGQFEITSTSGTVTIVGPGKDAPKKATIQASTDANAINIDPSTMNATLVLTGLTVIGNGNASVVACQSTGAGVAAVTVLDCSVSTSNKNAIFVSNCNATIGSSRIFGATQSGLSLGNPGNYSVQNCFINGNGTGVTFVSGSTGTFRFNTVAWNLGTIGIACSGAATVEDSIVFSNKQTAGTQFSGTACTLNNVVTGTDVYAGPGTKIQLSPSFVNSASDFHLDVTPGAVLNANKACCIDKIVPPPSPTPIPAIDIDNEARPKGASWDIGADEAL
jgi:hypothetical protein